MAQARGEPGRDPEGSAGLPVSEPPPLIEPLEIVEPAPSASGVRPPRRRFLAPLPSPAPAALSIPKLPPRPAMPERLALLPATPAERTAVPPPVPPTVSPARRRAVPDPEPAGAPPRRRRWRRRLAVVAGLVIALALASAAELGVTRQTLARFAALVAQQFAQPPTRTIATAPPADAPRRADWYAARAKAGDADAQLALAILYAKGDGVGQDYAAAAKWFEAAAERGVARAQYDLGVLYEHGRGLPLDYARAASWYRKAAEQNHPLAQYNLAVAYTKGEGVPHDFFEAAVWYRRAAAQGVVAAMVNLAILFERGEGVDMSTVDAYAWYKAAARRGNLAASRRADELLQAFSPADQTRAEAKTAEIAAAIHDAIGAESRAAAPPAPAPAARGGAAPLLRSGLEGEAEPGRRAAPASDSP